MDPIGLIIPKLGAIHLPSVDLLHHPIETIAIYKHPKKHVNMRLRTMSTFQVIPKVIFINHPFN